MSELEKLIEELDEAHKDLIKKLKELVKEGLSDD